MDGREGRDGGRIFELEFGFRCLFIQLIWACVSASYRIIPHSHARTVHPLCLTKRHCGITSQPKHIQHLQCNPPISQKTPPISIHPSNSLPSYPLISHLHPSTPFNSLIPSLLSHPSHLIPSSPLNLRLRLRKPTTFVPLLSPLLTSAFSTPQSANPPSSPPRR